MKEWYDAFRVNDGPTLYSHPNRTPVTGDVPIVAVCVLFATFFIAFLVIFPGVRKQRFTTFTTVTLSLFVGLVIMVTRLGSAWHTATAHILAPYKSFSREKLPAIIGAHIGLMHVNITLKGLAVGNWSSQDIDFNERFRWDAAQDMDNSYKKALRRGLPYPILTVAEYFSLGQEGFAWGGQYRAAGYHASILLWASLASWLLMNLLLVAVPRYGAYLKVLTGLLLISTNIGYYWSLPKPPLIIILEGGRLIFKLGWCYWLVLVAGVLCLLAGIIISVIDLVWPHTFSTILEVYFDTPYDRHVILEESHDVRYQKRNSKVSEEASGLGSRILRRLSSKTRDQTTITPATTTAASTTTPATATANNVSHHTSMVGIDNRAFEGEPSNSTWQYPFKRDHHQTSLQRTLSQNSITSSEVSIPLHSPYHRAGFSRSTMLP